MSITGTGTGTGTGKEFLIDTKILHNTVRWIAMPIDLHHLSNVQVDYVMRCEYFDGHDHRVVIF